MPFAALPSSPGFQQPPVPDWGRFAELAIQGIQHGGDLRAQASRDAMAQMDKSFEQVSKMIQFNSPEAKAERRLKMIQTAAMEKVYTDFNLHPEKYQMTAHGPILKDPLAVLQRQQTYNNAVRTGLTQDENLKSKRDADAARAASDLAIQKAAADKAKLSGGSSAAPDTGDASAKPVLVPDQPVPAGSSGPVILPLANTVAPTGSTGSDTNLNGEPIIDQSTGLPIDTQVP